MKGEIAYLWNKIDGYKDKEENILDIFIDAELAFLIAIDDEHKDQKKEVLQDKLIQIQSKMKKTPFGFDIYELDYWIHELKENSYWRDTITINDKKIEREQLKEWCYESYNTLRYFLLSTGVVDLDIGASGKQPKSDGEGEI
ncbi:hypothetical protein LCGC14_1163290 [marine sediment metagenome]|uniref:Uncharacterized protein n=1 Tax=marine sediment metagenome TaxID=412755 RepID=A0A0F9PA89_9ZZZZ